jgi:amino acid adenylation domain-containing protein
MRSASDTIVSRFQAVAAQYPDRVAVLDEQGSLTYRELLVKAEAVARGLIVTLPGPHVGIALAQDRELIVAMLGVLLAGKAYVPIDEAAPRDRMDLIVGQFPGLPLLARRGAAHCRGGPGGRAARRVLDVDDLAGREAPGVSLPAIDPEQVAYVIFTSGSTGAPKGVQVPHRSAVHFVENTTGIHPLGPDDVTCMFHSFAFDFTIWEIFGALLQGARVVVPDRRVSRSPAEFAEFLGRHGVTVLSQTPSAFSELLKVLGAEYRDRLAVRHIILGGEALRFSMLTSWFDLMGDRARVYNIYGPTETTVWVTCKEISGALAAAETDSVLGRPFPDARLQLVDEDLRPVAPGAPGEILIGGPQVSLGYFGQPALTAERFTRDTATGALAYRTGDLAVVRDDGDLVYLGRIDYQVQIRGHRVELGEIEAALCTLPEVGNCVVRLWERGGDPRLVAYLVETGPATDDQIRDALRDRLPGYMIPALLVRLPELPLTVNGKVDMTALPEPSSRPAPMPVSEAPSRSEVQDIVAQEWAQVIGVDTIAPDENFFDVGGTSMHVVDVYSRLVERLDVPGLAMIDLFEFTTVRTLTRHIDEQLAEQAAAAGVG